MNVEILDKNNFFNPSYIKKLKKIAVEILKVLKLPNNSELCISIIDDIEMRKLNNEYRKIKRTTDVLSFPQDDIQGFNILGDVVISYDTAKRHSKLYEITMHDELKKLLTHSILHLLGYDHKKKKDKDLMVSKENMVLEKLENL